MATEEKSAALQHVESLIAELERTYGIGGAERHAIIPEDVADEHRALVMRRRALSGE